MKRFITAVLAITLTLSIGTSLTFAADTVNVTIDGETQAYDPPPQIIDGRTMLPLRAVGESLGMAVDYDQDTKTATMEKDGKTVIHVIDTKTITVEGLSKEFDTASTIIDGRTLVPLRMLAEAIGADVEWIAETRTAVITTDAITPTSEPKPEPPKPEPAPTTPYKPNEGTPIPTLPVDIGDDGFMPRPEIDTSGEPRMIGDVLYDPSLLHRYAEYTVTSSEQAGKFFESMLKKSVIRINFDPENPDKYINATFDIFLVTLPHDWTWDVTVSINETPLSNTNLAMANGTGDMGTTTAKVENGHFTGSVTPQNNIDWSKEFTPEEMIKYEESMRSVEHRIGTFYGEVYIVAEIQDGSRNTVMQVEYKRDEGKAEAYYYNQVLGGDFKRTYLNHVLPTLLPDLMR